MFNGRLLEFFDDMDAVYQGAKQIRKGLTLAILLDRKLPHQTFKKHVAVPYGKQILARDEAFLLQQDYKSELQEAIAANSNAAVLGVDIVKELKGIWASLSPDNKDAIFMHMKVLVTLCNRIKS